MALVTVSPAGVPFRPTWDYIAFNSGVPYVYTPPYSVVGSSPQWGITDDTSYVDLTGWDIILHGGASHTLAVPHVVAEFAAMPTVIGVDLSSVVVRCQIFINATTPVAWGLVDTATHALMAVSTNTTATGSITNLNFTAVFLGGDVAGAFQAGTAAIAAFQTDVDPSTDNMLRVFGITVDVYTAEESGGAPLRRWPAVDNGGAGPTRHWPPRSPRLWPPIH